MQRDYNLQIGDTRIKLAIDWQTSLDIMDEVASPSMIAESIVAGMTAVAEGKSAPAEFEFNERNAVKIVELAHAKFDRFSADQIGTLMAQFGWANSYAAVSGYILELTFGKKRQTAESEPVAEGEQPAEK